MDLDDTATALPEPIARPQPGCGVPAEAGHGFTQLAGTLP